MPKKKYDPKTDPEAAYRKIQDAEPSFALVFGRMDTDAKLARRDKFYLQDENGVNIPNCEHVTLNKAALFAQRANVLIAGAEQQIEVEGEGLSDEDVAPVETFLSELYEGADENLDLRTEPAMFATLGEYANLRGRAAMRICLRVEEGRTVCDLLPLDPRYLIYSLGPKGFRWAAYKTMRLRSEVEEEHETVISAERNTEGEVTDLWTAEEEIVYFEGKHVVSKPNMYRYPPIVYAKSPAGLYLKDKVTEKYCGESIFWLNRDLYPEANKCISIIQSMNVGSLWPPMQKEYRNIPLKKPKYPMGAKRTVAAVEKGELYHPMPRQDVYQATRMAWAIIDSHIQQGSLSVTQFGTLQFPLSAVALEELAEGQTLVLLPSLQCLSMLYRKASRMAIGQYVKFCEGVPVGPSGKTYDKEKLEQDYKIKFRYYAKSKKQMIAGITEAAAVGDLVSDDFKRREMIGLRNPDQQRDRVRAEKAERLSPVLTLYNQVHALIDQGEEVQAEILLRQLERLLRQQSGKQGGQNALSSIIRESGAGPKAMIPLVGGNVGRQSTRQSEGIEEATLRKEEQEVS